MFKFNKMKKVKVIRKASINAVKSNLNVGYGEVTGHTHALNGNVSVLNMSDTPSGPQVMDYIAEEDATLVHEEHDRMPLAPARYFNGKQQEFNVVQNTTIQVRD